MLLTKLGHACLLVEAGGARILVDPGTFSSGFEQLTGLSAILITHLHADHLDTDRIGELVAANPQAQVVTEAQAGQVLTGLGVAVRTVAAGDTLDVGLQVRVLGSRHAEIHPDIPRVANVGFLIEGRLLHPGDALTVPDEPVDVLALPMVAPWMAVRDMVDYLRAVRPRVAVPIHDALAADPRLYHRFAQQLAPPGVEFSPIDAAGPTAL